MSLAAAFTISLVGAVLITAAAYPLILWVVCKFTPVPTLPPAKTGDDVGDVR
jgi:hypothetical protein